MSESGDKASPPFFQNSEKVLITKLLKISENGCNEEKDETGAICGWQPAHVTDTRTKSPTEKTKLDSKVKSVQKGNNALQWKEVLRLESVQKSNKDEVTQVKKKGKKFHKKRIDELSHPRKIRDKVVLRDRSRMVAPFNNRKPLNPAVYFGNQLFTVSRIALQYGETGPELRRLSEKIQRLPALRSESSHSAREKEILGKSIRDILSSKNQSHSAGVVKDGRIRGTAMLPSILVKTRANVGVDWDNSFVLNDTSDDEAADHLSNSANQNLGLPIPQAKLGNNKASCNNQKNGETFPAIRFKTKRHKGALGSITAITQGTIKAGMNTSSIRKIRRQAVPHSTVILPKLSGSRVEVPLLPQSPDFLHHIL